MNMWSVVLDPVQVASSMLALLVGALAIPIAVVLAGLVILLAFLVR